MCIFPLESAEYSDDTPQIAQDVVCGVSGCSLNTTNQGYPSTISASKKFNFYTFNAR
jgi:hypothetical protein